MPAPHVQIVDDLFPEDGAMLQALYSRSDASVETHLEKVRALSSGKFMERFYVGYGHQSIGDCGTTTIFIENVSLLAAKAIQDWPLYSGQECSTRYLDMSRRTIVDPIGTTHSFEILDAWTNFYTVCLDRIVEPVRQKYPRKPDEAPEVYERAVKARSFDIMRSFLPAAVTTNLSWHTNLRQAADHLPTLLNHPCEEVRVIGQRIRDLMAHQYPASGFDKPYTPEQTQWHQRVSEQAAYASFPVDEFRHTIDLDALASYHDLTRNRPPGGLLPHFLTDLGQVHFGFRLDFGSYRDIQRHRNGVCRTALLTTALGFEPWYLDQINQLDHDLGRTARGLVRDQTEAIEALDIDLAERQYFTALGFRVPVMVTYALPAAVYVLELRSGRTVHPTLRKRAHEMVASFKETFPDVTLHADLSPDDWDIRRGLQTIIPKGNSVP